MALCAAIALPASGAMGYSAVQYEGAEPSAVDTILDYARPVAAATQEKGEKAAGLSKATSPGEPSEDVAPEGESEATTLAEPETQDEDADAPEEEPASTGRAIAGGEASYYGRRFAGRRTANGETFDPSQMTAAHRTLPFGSRVRVTHRRSGRSVVVRINDRGPFHGGRVIDLSRAAASSIGMISAGRAQVDLELLD